MNNIKKIGLSVIACATIASSLATSAGAYVEVDLYKNVNGGPSNLSESVEIYKNDANSYYAECTYISNGSVRVKGVNNTPSKALSFTTEDEINFLATTSDSYLEFTVTYTPSGTTGQANMELGSY